MHLPHFSPEQGCLFLRGQDPLKCPKSVNGPSFPGLTLFVTQYYFAAPLGAFWKSFQNFEFLGQSTSKQAFPKAVFCICRGRYERYERHERVETKVADLLGCKPCFSKLVPGYAGKPFM